MTTKSDFNSVPRPLPADLVDVALIDAPTCAAAGDMSVSWWHGEVLAGRAPAPVIRRPRCTRWRLADVRAYWSAAATDATVGQRVASQAKKASDAAKAKRVAATEAAK